MVNPRRWGTNPDFEDMPDVTMGCDTSDHPLLLNGVRHAPSWVLSVFDPDCPN